MGERGDGGRRKVQRGRGADGPLDDELGARAAAQIEEVALFKDLDKPVPRFAGRSVPFGRC